MDEDEIRTFYLRQLHDAPSWDIWEVIIYSSPAILLTAATVDWAMTYAKSVASDSKYARLSSDLQVIAEILRRCIIEGLDSVLSPLLEQSNGGDSYVAGLLQAAELGLSVHADLEMLKQSISLYDAALTHPAMKLAPIGQCRLA